MSGRRPVCVGFVAFSTCTCARTMRRSVNMLFVTYLKKKASLNFTAVKISRRFIIFVVDHVAMFSLTLTITSHVIRDVT